MSALPLAVDAATTAFPNHTDSSHERSITSAYRLVQKPSAWAVSRLRRYLDCVVALLLILIALPILVMVGLMVRLTSPGPVLFCQKRMGRHGKEFMLYKFRSMRVDYEACSPITVSGDPRITRLGSLLRRYKLDELPQLWNVLRGDMSLVGPRPKLPHHEALLMSARPSITGPATLAFRREEELLLCVPKHQLEIFYEVVIKPTKAQIDFEYMRNATFQSDMNLLWATLASCLGFSKREIVPVPWSSELRHRP